MNMTLKVLLPTEVLIEQKVTKINAKADLEFTIDAIDEANRVN